MALSNEYIGRSHIGLPSTNEIIALCREKGGGFNGFTYPSNGSPIACIKYGYTVAIGEMRTQHYVYNAFEQMMNASGSGVKAPEIYHAFECGGQTYIVMEYVDRETVGALLNGSSTEKRHWIYEQVAKAINQLLQVPVPSGSRPGPVGGGHIHHYLFPDHVAAKEYESIDDLQRHINKVDFSNKELCLCYSDIMEGNFLITQTGQIYVIDFEDAAFLPTSFIGFVLNGSKKPLARRIADKVSVPKSANHAAMGLACYYFNICSNPRIGL